MSANAKTRPKQTWHWEESEDKCPRCGARLTICVETRADGNEYVVAEECPGGCYRRMFLPE